MKKRPKFPLCVPKHLGTFRVALWILAKVYTVNKNKLYTLCGIHQVVYSSTRLFPVFSPCESLKPFWVTPALQSRFRGYMGGTVLFHTCCMPATAKLNPTHYFKHNSQHKHNNLHNRETTVFS